MRVRRLEAVALNVWGTMMNEAAVTVALRIPGTWSHPREIVERLPAGYRLTPESLFLPDGTELEFAALKPDRQFAEIFRTSCREPATDEELAAVQRYTVNACLRVPGGSLDAARVIMQSASALLAAGGAGVFVDNSCLAHGAQNWLGMTDDGSSDALSFAFVAIIGGKTEARTLGMHILGLRDIVMNVIDAQSEDFGIIDVVRYMAASDKPVDDGHVLCDLNGPRFRASAQASRAEMAGSPIHNPFGRLKLVSMKEIAESN